MPKKSDTGNVFKRCDCNPAKWSQCAHKWHAAFKAKKNHPNRPNGRYRVCLDDVAGKHAKDQHDAQAEAWRAFTAWLDMRDPKDLQPSDRVTLTALLDDYIATKKWKKPPTPKRIAALKQRAAFIARQVVADRPFGDWFIDQITTDHVLAYQQQRTVSSGRGDFAELLKPAFKRAVIRGLLPSSPCRVKDYNAVSLPDEDGRSRRLEPGEEERLRAAVGSDTQYIDDILTAILEGALRIGEVLSMQWHQILRPQGKHGRYEIFIPADKAKSGKPRRVPCSSVLKAVIDRRQKNLQGHDFARTDYVFGNEVDGSERKGIKSAWLLLMLRANAIKPTYVKTKRTPAEVAAAVAAGKTIRTKRTLSAATRKALRIVDLHVHDLRREGASRWMDAGVPLAKIRDWLGHHSIAQTCQYLAASMGGDADAMAAFETRVGRVEPTTLTAEKNMPQRGIFSGHRGQQTSGHVKPHLKIVSKINKRQRKTG